MSRTRFRIVFIVLVLILLLVSVLFGILTYWLDADVPPAATSKGENEQPLGHHTSRATRTAQLGWDLHQSDPSTAVQRMGQR
jgi:hypothetical protein